MYACFLFEVLSSNCIIEVSFLCHLARSFLTCSVFYNFPMYTFRGQLLQVRSLNCKKGGWLAWAGWPGAPGPGSLGRLEQESGRWAVVTNSRIDYFYGHCYCKIDGCPGAKGQLNSEWIYEVIVSSKIPNKIFPGFCPTEQTRIIAKENAYTHQKIT